MSLRADWRHKGFPSALPVEITEDTGWNLLRGDLLMPCLVMKRSAVAHNIAVVHGYLDQLGVSISPHVKTTMSPELIEWQLAEGAWGVTVANVGQARVVAHFGCERILIANEVVDPVGIDWLAEVLDTTSIELMVLVDSPEAVALLDEGLKRRSPSRPLRVLLEIGLMGGRSGCRRRDRWEETLAAVAGSTVLELAGVEAYEGIIHDGDLDEVDRFLDQVWEIAVEIDGRGLVTANEFVVSAGGSSFPDRVIQRFGPWESESELRIVVRSGCYVTHDHGMYEEASPFGSRLATEALRPALEIWGVVVSRPEPDLCIVNFGKRDVAYDLSLPQPILISRRGSGEVLAAEDLAIFDLNDQHAYVRVPETLHLGPGDLLAAGLSHPCTVFDKWRMIPLVDDDYEVVGAVSTYF